MADKKPTIKVKIPPLIPKKPEKKLIVKLPREDLTSDLLSIDKQKDLVNSWITNKSLNNYLTSFIDKEQTEDKLRKLVGEKLDCEKYEENKCSIINFPNEDFILVRHYSGKSFFIILLDLIFSDKDYNKVVEIKKIRDKCKENGIEMDIIDKLTKEINMIDLELTKLKSILEILNELYSFNFMIFLEKFYSKNGIVSSLKEGQSLIGINIEEKRIYKIGFFDIETKKVEYINSNKEIESEIKENSIGIKEEKTEAKKPRIPISIASKPKEPKEIGEYISINPDDLLVKLPIVKVNIEGNDYQFLMGKTGNLYTKTSDNKLIGRVKGGELLLVEGYKEYL
jgi:hypothetical protein